jgi:hypothetical protein
MDQLTRNWPARWRGPKITPAEFRKCSTQSALARWRTEINEPTFRYGRTLVSSLADFRPTAMGIADNLSTQLSRWGELLFSARTTILWINPSHGESRTRQNKGPSRHAHSLVAFGRSGDRP